MTKIGIFVQKQWEFDMYFKLFYEMISGIEQVKGDIDSRDEEARIISENYYVRIFRMDHPRAFLGMRFDTVINTIQDEAFYNCVLVPSLCVSKFVR